jgi:hypothetical protein
MPMSRANEIDGPQVSIDCEKFLLLAEAAMILVLTARFLSIQERIM